MHPDQQRALDYLRRKGSEAPVEKLRAQLSAAFAEIERAFDDVREEERALAPAEGKWSAHEILDHLVLSHGPAIPQFASLLEGKTPEGVAIPADLHRDAGERPPWDALRAQLAETHRELERLMDGATDAHSLEPKALIEMVLKIDGERVAWHERSDWKAFILGVRVHTIEHGRQLQRTLEVLRNETSSARS